MLSGTLRYAVITGTTIESDTMAPDPGWQHCELRIFNIPMGWMGDTAQKWALHDHDVVHRDGAGRRRRRLPPFHWFQG